MKSKKKKSKKKQIKKSQPKKSQPKKSQSQKQLAPQQTKKQHQIYDTLHFWLKVNSDYELMFSYARPIGEVILFGLSKNNSWLVKNELDKVVYALN